jgi:hypothetical protein
MPGITACIEAGEDEREVDGQKRRIPDLTPFIEGVLPQAFLTLPGILCVKNSTDAGRPGERPGKHKEN